MLAGTIQPQPSLEESRRYMQQQMAQLPEELLNLEAAATPYPVHFSKCLMEDLENLRSQTCSPVNPLVH
jgi:hypothetical protein